MKAKTWRCFHCGDVFRSRKQARLHFGTDEYEEKQPPACVDPLRGDEKAWMDRLREAEQYALKCQEDAAQSADRADMAEQELAEFRRITECANTHELRMWMDYQRGRVVVADALSAGFRKAVPELAAQIIG